MGKAGGGSGNAAELIDAARAEGHETAGAFHMAGAEKTAARLATQGFVDVEAWLEPRTIAFETREEMVDYIVTPYLRPATSLPEPELRTLGEAIADRLGRLAVDYVRLNVTARKG